MAKNISLILHRFKDVRTSILTLIFEDSPRFNNNGAQRYFGSHELSDLLEKLGKTREEAAEILEKVIPTPSHYRLQLSLNDEQEKHARRTFRVRGSTGSSISRALTLLDSKTVLIQSVLN